MAIYHLSAKVISRQKGRSATGAAAYRAAEEIIDERTGMTHDYTRKRGVDYTKIIGWQGSRSQLWNQAEQSEKRKDATVAREYEVAIPIELNNDEKIKLTVGFATWLHRRHAVAVDIAIHNIDSENPHAHILTSTRVVENNQFGEKTAREWSDSRRKKHGFPGRKYDLNEARDAWEKFANTMLERANIDERIDRRSLEDQGIKKIPQIHLGPKNNDRLKKGKTNARIDKFEVIKVGNESIKKLEKLDEKVQEMPTQTFERFAQKTGNRLDELEGRIKKERIKEGQFKKRLERATARTEELKIDRQVIKESRRSLLQKKEFLNPFQVLTEAKINKALESIESRFTALGEELDRLTKKIIPMLQKALNTISKCIESMSQQFERIEKSFDFSVNTLEQRGYFNEQAEVIRNNKSAANDTEISLENPEIKKLLVLVPEYSPSRVYPVPKF